MTSPASKMDLYCLRMSPPSRAVLMTLKAVDLTSKEVNFITVDTFKGEHLKEDYVALNPQHCVPTLVDGELTICESRAIMTYLASRYGKDDSLYPRDPVLRARVDRLLYFDATTLFQRFLNYALGKLWGTESQLDPAKLRHLEEAFEMLNTLLEGKTFAAGGVVTVADHALLTSCESLAAAGMPVDKYANINAWRERCRKEMPYFEEAQEGIEAFRTFARSKLESS